MPNEQTVHNASQNIILENRKKAVISGIKEVESFNENEIFLFTELGELKIRGKDLHISEVNIDSGKMTLSGYVQSLIYGEEKKIPKNFITKVFK